MRHRALWLQIAALSLSLVTTLTHANVGRTPGTFAVSPTGAATYQIPIWMPPGPKGIQPNLAIAYNSQADVGILGPGWGLAGLTEISRCNKTYAQDGAPAGVTLSVDDGYCLSGNRLRRISGDYGVAGSIYQTELADFSLVTAYGATGNGPQYFIVKGKDGLTYEYGSTTDSAVLTGTTAYRWLLNKVSDRSGNSYVVTYTSVNTTNSAVPLSISYTRSSAGSTNYNYTVNFGYAAAGSIVGNVAGFEISNTNFLTDITINSGAATIKKYVISYQAAPASLRARLTQVKECADAAAADCLAPTTITYQDGQAGVGTETTALGSSGLVGSNETDVSASYDFDGDGYYDLVYSSSGVYYVSFKTGGGYGTPVNTGLLKTSGGVTSLIGRVLGNGKDGFLVNVGNVWWFYVWNGGAFTGASTGIGVDSVSQNNPLTATLADTNGDGLKDLVTLRPDGYLYIRLNTSVGGAASFSTSAVQTFYFGTPTDNWSGLSQIPDVPSPDGPRFLDFNGDGRQDFVGYKYDENYNVSSYLVLTNGSTLSAGQALSNAFLGFRLFNDDECSDIFELRSVTISPCKSSSGSTISLGTATEIGSLSMDWNGDGRSDMLVQYGSNFGVHLSTGSSLTSVQTTTVPYSGTMRYQVTDVDGDGLDDLIAVSAISPYPVTYRLHNGAGQLPDLVTSITDGYGVVFSPTYVSIAQSNYTKGSGAVYPEQDVKKPLYVVSQFATTDGVNGTYTQSYAYSGARQDLQGRGFEGFQSVSITDSRPNTPVVKTYYKTAFPYTGMVYQQDAYQHNGSTLISHTVNTPATLTLDGSANNQRYFVYLSNSTVNRYEIDGRLITTTSTSNGTPDSYGNFSNVNTTTTDNDTASPYYNQSWTTTITNAITNDPGANWCLGRPSSVTVAQSASNGETSVSRITNYSIDYGYCRIAQQVVAPGTTYQVTTAFGYDSFGNVNNQTVTGYNMAARTTTANWGDTGQFPISVTNALSQSFSAGYDYNRGLQTSQTDANNLTTSWAYDSFGRKTLETRPEGTSTLWGYSLCSGCDPLPRMVVTAQPRDSVGNVISTRTDYFDMLDRPIYQLNQLLDGSTAWTTSDYDVLGNVLHDYVPYLSSGGTNGYVTYSYDALNRLIKKQPSSGAALTTQYQYAGRTTTTIDANNHATTTISDVNGWTRKTTDASGYTITNAYDAAGSLTGVTDSQSGTLFSASYVYGIQPFKISTWDSDLGPAGYTPNALGEVVAYTDAKGQGFSIAYDPLSRPTQRTEAEGITTWSWGTSAAAHEIGQLHSISSPGYLETYAYDGAGRLSNRQIASDTTYNYDFTYNTQGQIDTLTYPTSTAGYRLKLQYLYQTGMLRQVKDYNASTVFWQANTMNPRGQLTQEQLGNGIIANRNYDPVTGWLNYIQCGIGGGACSQNQSYLYDNVGNVIQRQNNNLGLTENFNYDAVNRLASSTLNGTQNLGVSYDGQGNITSRSDVGSFDYTTQQASCGSYAGYTPQPHAVRKAAGNVYCYDKNGNMTSRAGNSISWTTYNYPSQISGSNETINLYYDANRQRYKQTYTVSGMTETTMYVGGLMQKVSVNGIDDYRYSIYGNGQLIALMSRTSAGANTTRYVLTDHQGSVAKFTDSSGNSIVSESFTAFGARRNPQTWSGQPTYGDQTSINGISREGYTGQTALGTMGLNHMNGRVQDAVTGRFLSADPYITEPGNTQNYNRYSYVHNNPLSYTDPSGFCRLDGGYGDPYSDLDCLEDVPAWGYPPATPEPPQLPSAPAVSNGSNGGSSAGEPLTTQTEKPSTCPIGPAQGPGSMFDNDDAAAIDLLKYGAGLANGEPATNKLERGGDITPFGGGFTYNDVQTGTTGSVNVRVATNAVAWAHTHPPESPLNAMKSQLDSLNRFLSPGDIANGAIFNQKLGRGLIAYLGGSDGAIRKFAPKAYKGAGETICPAGYLKY